MTDAPEEPPAFVTEQGGARRPRVGESGSPVGSTLSIILAVIAVIAGFLILRAITDDDGGGGAGAIEPSTGTTPATLGPGPITVTPGTTVPVPTVPAGPVYSGATIVVANASGIGGSAAAMSNALTTEGYENVGDPGNATGAALATSVVYYVAGDTAAQAVAQSIATDLGGVQTGEMPAERPASGGGVDSATVLVMLGSDAAEKTLAELSGAATPADTVVPPPAIITQP